MLSFPGNPASIVDPALISSAHHSLLSLCHPHGSISTNEDLAKVLHESNTTRRKPKYFILPSYSKMRLVMECQLGVACAPIVTWS